MVKFFVLAILTVTIAIVSGGGNHGKGNYFRGDKGFGQYQGNSFGTLGSSQFGSSGQYYDDGRFGSFQQTYPAGTGGSGGSHMFSSFKGRGGFGHGRGYGSGGGGGYGGNKGGHGPWCFGQRGNSFGNTKAFGGNTFAANRFTGQYAGNSGSSGLTYADGFSNNQYMDNGQYYSGSDGFSQGVSSSQSFPTYDSGFSSSSAQFQPTYGTGQQVWTGAEVSANKIWQQPADQKFLNAGSVAGSSIPYASNSVQYAASNVPYASSINSINP